MSIINSLKNKANFSFKNTLIITDDKKSHIYKFANKFKIKVIFHRKYIGGRYSVFTETALIPCYFMGINTFKLRKETLNFLYKKKSSLIKNVINLSKVYNSKKLIL